MRGGYGTGAGLESSEAVKELVGEVSMGFGSEGLCQKVGHLVVSCDVAKSYVAGFHLLKEVVEVFDKVVGLRRARLVLDDVHGRKRVCMDDGGTSLRVANFGEEATSPDGLPDCFGKGEEFCFR